jgi:hypothetical protein
MLYIEGDGGWLAVMWVGGVLKFTMTDSEKISVFEPSALKK